MHQQKSIKNKNLLFIIGLFNQAIGLMSSVHQWSMRQEFNLRSSHTKDSKNGTWGCLA